MPTRASIRCPERRRIASSRQHRANWGAEEEPLHDIAADNESPLSKTPSPPVSPSPCALTAASSAAAADRRPRPQPYLLEGQWRAPAAAGGRVRQQRQLRPGFAPAVTTAAISRQRFAAGACMPAAPAATGRGRPAAAAACAQRVQS